MVSDLSTQKQWLYRTMRSMQKRIAIIRNILQILALFATGLATWCGLKLSVVTSDEARHQWLLWGAVAVAVLLLSTLLSLLGDIAPPDAVMRMVRLVEELETAEAAEAQKQLFLSWLSNLYNLSLSFQGVMRQFVQAGRSATPDMMVACETLLDLLVRERDFLLGFDGSRWSCSVYRFNASSGLLELAATRRPSRREETEPHRSWPPGQGHIGQAYLIRREVISGDTNQPDVKVFFDGSGANYRADDTARYRSVASIPVFAADRTVWGVVVATCGRAGHFGQGVPELRINYVEPVRRLAATLETMLQIA